MPPSAKKHLRITGVVRIMNQVRAQWQPGISPAQAADLRRLAESTTDQVEKICQKYKMKPDALPTPTLRAYRYLKNLDRQELPPSGDHKHLIPQPSASRPLRVHNLVSFCTSLQQNFHQEVLKKTERAGQDPSHPWHSKSLLERIQAMTVSVEKLAAEAQASLASLPAPSRRAYLWLKFLSQPDNLERHLRAMESAYQILQARNCGARQSAGRNPPPAQVEFYSLPALYRARIEGGILNIVANEGYISAPPPVLEALVCAARLGTQRAGVKKAPFLAKIKDYAQDSAFRQIALSVEHVPILPLGNIAMPEALDYTQEPRLVALFQRINTRYFAGELPQPRLTWNKIITHRKLGHYQESTDTVMISQTLDQPGVPEFVLEFVMYHELLHKKLGTQRINGRHYAHTPTFRAEERKFTQYAEATSFLANLGREWE